jgi:hypothetical protein
MKVVIDVTQEDIANNQTTINRMRTRSCPISSAVSRKFGKLFASGYSVCFDNENPSNSFTLPLEVTAFIRKADNAHSEGQILCAAPFSFEVEVIDNFLTA